MEKTNETISNEIQNPSLLLSDMSPSSNIENTKETSEESNTEHLNVDTIAPELPLEYLSWKDFDIAFQSYCIMTNQQYKLKAVISIENYISLRDCLLTTTVNSIPESLEIYSKQYICAYHEELNRDNEDSVTNGECPAEICVSIQAMTSENQAKEISEDMIWKIIVTKHFRSHNHSLLKDKSQSSLQKEGMYPQLVLPSSDISFSPTSKNKRLVGMEFDGWDSFHRAIQAYGNAIQQQFRIRSTVSIASKNARTKAMKQKNYSNQYSIINEMEKDDESTDFPSHFKWYSKMLICKNGWRRASRSKIAQEEQKTNSILGTIASDGDLNIEAEQMGLSALPNKSCPAMIFARLQKNFRGQWRITISRHVVEHNHLLESSHNRDYDNSSSKAATLHESAVSAISLLTSQSERNLSMTTQLSNVNTDREVVVRVPKLPSVHASWEALHTALESYSNDTFQSYRTRTTTSVSGRNQKILEMQKSQNTQVNEKGNERRNGNTLMIPEEYQIYSKTLVCTHGWKERYRGTGKRTIQVVRSTACPVKICATLQRRTNTSASEKQIWEVVVTKHIVDHNHNLSRELHQHYRENRRIYDSELLVIDQNQSGLVEKPPIPIAKKQKVDIGSQQNIPHASDINYDNSQRYTPPISNQLSQFQQQESLLQSASQSLLSIDTHGHGALSLYAHTVSHENFQIPANSRELSLLMSVPQSPPFSPLLSSTNISKSSQLTGSELFTVNSSNDLGSHQLPNSDRIIHQAKSHVRVGSANDSGWAIPTPTSSVAFDNIPNHIVAINNPPTIWRVPSILQYHDTWESFQAVLTEYSRATFQLYRVRTTTSVAARNTKIMDQVLQNQLNNGNAINGEEQRTNVTNLLIPSHFQWYSKTYCCTHGWKPRRRGTGRRVAHTIRSTECPVKICVTLQRNQSVQSTSLTENGEKLSQSWHVVVTKHIVEHNHPVSGDAYEQYCENRRVNDPELLQQALQLWKKGATRRTIFEFLKSRSTKALVIKDVHNLVQRWKKQEQRMNDHYTLLDPESQDHIILETTVDARNEVSYQDIDMDVDVNSV